MNREQHAVQQGGDRPRFLDSAIPHSAIPHRAICHTGSQRLENPSKHERNDEDQVRGQEKRTSERAHDCRARGDQGAESEVFGDAVGGHGNAAQQNGGHQSIDLLAGPEVFRDQSEERQVAQRRIRALQPAERAPEALRWVEREERADNVARGEEQYGHDKRQGQPAARAIDHASARPPNVFLHGQDDPRQHHHADEGAKQGDLDRFVDLGGVDVDGQRGDDHRG